MNSNDQYRRALSQGMTPCEAEQEVAEAEEYERVEREMEQHFIKAMRGCIDAHNKAEKEKQP